MPRKKSKRKKKSVVWDRRRYPRKTKKKFISNTRNMDDPAYKVWRQEVFKRDGRHCQFGGCCSKDRVSAHHILTWSEYPLLRFEVGNGITLCHKHHAMVKNRESDFISMFQKIILGKLREKINEIRRDN